MNLLKDWLEISLKILNEETIKNKLSKNKKWIYLGLTIFMMIFIFLMSSRNPEPFKKRGCEVYRDGIVACFVFVPGFDKINWDTRLDIARKVDYPVRYGIHLLEYLILGNLLWAFIHHIYNEAEKNKKLLGIMSVCLCLFAITDEIHQYFAIGQCGIWYDVIFETLVALVGICISKIYIKMKKIK